MMQRKRPAAADFYEQSEQDNAPVLKRFVSDKTGIIL